MISCYVLFVFVCQPTGSNEKSMSASLTPSEPEVLSFGVELPTSDRHPGIAVGMTTETANNGRAKFFVSSITKGSLVDRYMHRICYMCIAMG